MSGGQFHWGGGLLKSNGGAQRFPQSGRQSDDECKGTRELDCETYKSNRDESRASDPMVARGCAMAHRLKGTPGITG